MGNKAKMYVDIMSLHTAVTGSCFLCIVKLPDKQTKRFVVDCGLFREEEYNELNKTFPFDSENVDFALVTHNHVDHTGRIPMMYNKGFTGKTYCTNATKLLLPLALYDSQSLLEDICKRQHTKVFYSVSDVDNTIRNVIGVNYDENVEITPNISVKFLHNNHIIGASMIFVEITYPGEEPICLLFTGDYKSTNVFMDDFTIPEEILSKRLTIITESTYGYMNTSEIVPLFDSKVVETLNEGKTILIPVLSLGRSQEILLKLKQLQDSEAISTSIPIYFDGKLAQCYTNLYLKNDIILDETKRNFLPQNLTWVNCESRKEVLSSTSTKIIVTTSGMGSFGPARIYIPHYISKRDALILFTSFIAEGTFGAKLKETNVGEYTNLGGLICKKLAEVSYCTEFSGHAKADELISLLKQFSNIRAILINHGEEESKEKFARLVLDKIETSSVGILNRNYFFRIDTWGVNKTLSTKFEQS